MDRIPKRIEVVCSNIGRLSSTARATQRAVVDVLSLHYLDVVATMVDSYEDLQALAARQPDLVFAGMKFVPLGTKSDIDSSQKIWLPSYLQEFGIACTGSGAEAYALELNKVLAKDRLLSKGLKTAKYEVVPSKATNLSLKSSLVYPLFIKPTNRRGGQGIDAASLARDPVALEHKLHEVCRSLGADALVEEFLPGREFSVAILQHTEPGRYSVMPIELIAPETESGLRILSKQIKNDNSERVVAVEDEEIRESICRLAMDSFEALGAAGYGRIDIRLDAAGTPHFLEANLTPSITEGYGSFPKACELNEDLGYEEMLLRIVSVALDTANREKHATIPVLV